MPRPTKYLDLADTLTRRIEGTLKPGDSFLTVREIAEQYDVGKNTADRVVQLLKERGVISGKPNGKTWVRVPPKRTERSNERYFEEKQLVHEPEAVRRNNGQTERDQGISLRDIAEDVAHHETIPCPEDVAAVLGLAPGTLVLRRTRVRRYDKKAGASGSASYVPLDIVERDPAVFDEDNDPWPGGMQHQLYTVGLELSKIVDNVTATMPTEDEAAELDIPPGVPMFRIRKISYATTGRAVEVTDFPLPAERTVLTYVTTLPTWSDS
ncbi:UTRA domain-containing protein [Streptomyces sp. 3N207]|uniref:UTRA domain-containing protein n=1 Tax=Streptomyces sp. 3N207 TaxID=3457417 RepID=UPI003FD1A766